MIRGLAHVCFTTGDLEASIAFYCGTLGFAPAFDFLNERGERYGAYLHVGGRTFLELFRGEVGDPAERPSYRHLCLEVDDMEAAVASLRAKGAEVTAPKLGSDRSWQAWLAEPDGNRIELHAYTSESRQRPFLTP